MKKIFKILLQCSFLFLVISVTGQKRQTNFSFITPVAGMKSMPLWTKESAVTIKWKGGTSRPVNLKLIDMRTFVVDQTIAEGIDDIGSYEWKIPATIPPGVYSIFIEDIQREFFRYSPDFAIDTKDFSESLKKSKAQ